MVGSDLISSVAHDRRERESVALNASTQVLYVQDGFDFREADDRDVVIRAQELVARRFRRGLSVLTDPWAMRSFLHLHLALSPQMCFGALFLDKRKRLLAFQEIFRGTIDEVTVHPREVVREALACNASCAIVVRSDPAGDAIFSATDAMLWRRVSEALDVADIAVLDYMLVGARVVSCVEEGWIYTKAKIQSGLPATLVADPVNPSAYRSADCSNRPHRIRYGGNPNEFGQPPTPIARSALSVDSATYGPGYGSAGSGQRHDAELTVTPRPLRTNQRVK